MNTQTIIETRRLRLRTLNADDAEFYLELVNDPSFIENIRDKGIRTIDQAAAAIQSGHVDVQSRQGFSLFLVERLEDGASLGLCGLVKRDSLPGIDIGYALLPRYWGHSYAFEACDGVIKFGTERIKLDQLFAIVSPHNTASCNLLEKLGFCLQNTIPWDDGGEVKLFHIDLALPSEYSCSPSLVRPEL